MTYTLPCHHPDFHQTLDPEKIWVLLTPFDEIKKSPQLSYTAISDGENRLVPNQSYNRPASQNSGTMQFHLKNAMASQHYLPEVNTREMRKEPGKILDASMIDQQVRVADKIKTALDEIPDTNKHILDPSYHAQRIKGMIARDEFPKQAIRNYQDAMSPAEK